VDDGDRAAARRPLRRRDVAADPGARASQARPFRAAADGTFEVVVPSGRYRLREALTPAGRSAAVSAEEVEVTPECTVEQTFVLR